MRVSHSYFKKIEILRRKKDEIELTFTADLNDSMGFSLSIKDAKELIAALQGVIND